MFSKDLAILFILYRTLQTYTFGSTWIDFVLVAFDKRNCPLKKTL